MHEKPTNATIIHRQYNKPTGCGTSGALTTGPLEEKEVRTEK
jgi:hypothetical protein